METIKAPAALTIGCHRAASHNKIGNTSAAGTTVSERLSGRETVTPLIAPSTASAVRLSMASRHDGGRRSTAAIAITSGATETMPAKSDTIQCNQVAVGSFRVANSQ